METRDAIEVRPLTSDDLDASFDVFSAVAAEGEREGVLRQHYRRANGKLWDAVIMSLLLTSTD